MEQENKNRTTYICGICNTKPEQLSHHKAHLNSSIHAEQKIICEYYIRRYILDFRSLIDDEYWNIYLQDDYLAVKISFTEIQKYNEDPKYSEFYTFEDWIIRKSDSIEKIYNLKNIPDENFWINKYNEKTHKCCNFEDKIAKILFLDWKIKYLIKEAETIQQTVKKSRRILSCEIINKINNNEIDETFLLNKFVNEISSNDKKNETKVYDAYREFNILKEKQQSILKNENETQLDLDENEITILKNENETQLDLDENEITILKNENIIYETQHDLNGNKTTIIRGLKKCNINDKNLSYIIYLKFKDAFVCKNITVETIILGKTEIQTKELWFFKGEEITDDKTREIFKTIKKYIIDLLHNSTILEKKIKNELIKNLKIPKIMSHLTELFMSSPLHVHIVDCK
jgi:hypothetical protein